MYLTIKAMKKITLRLVLLLLFTFNFGLSTLNCSAQWQQTNGPYGGKQISCIAISGSNIFTGIYGCGVFLSSNNGSSWAAVNTGLPITDVVALAISGNNIFAGTNNGVFRSSNNGSNWVTVNTGLTNTDVWSLAINDSNIFAGTNGGGVWKRALSEMVGIEETNNNENNIAVYPNPATDKIQVISKQYSVSSIEIYNLLGEKIYSSPVTDNLSLITDYRSPITIDVSSFPSGVYVVKVKTEKGVWVKKFVKE